MRIVLFFEFIVNFHETINPADGWQGWAMCGFAQSSALAQTAVPGSPNDAKKQAADRSTEGEEAQEKTRLDDLDGHQEGGQKTEQNQGKAEGDYFPRM
jgi:hypothetical protein